jgi:hypothetical protein
MKWESILPFDLDTPSGIKIPKGTVWQIQANSGTTGLGILICQTIDQSICLSNFQYIQMFGEDEHVWIAIQKILPTQTQMVLETKKGDVWTIVDFDEDRVIGNCLIDGIIKVAGKKNKGRKVVSTSFTYLEYIDVFGEDHHIDKRKTHFKRFDL